MLGHTDKDTTAKSDSRSIICNSHIDKEKTANSNSGNIIFDSHIDDVMKTNSDSTSRSILANSHTDKGKKANSHRRNIIGDSRTDKDTTENADNRSIIGDSRTDKKRTSNSYSRNVIVDSHIGRNIIAVYVNRDEGNLKFSQTEASVKFDEKRGHNHREKEMYGQIDNKDVYRKYCERKASSPFKANVISNSGFPEMKAGNLLENVGIS